MNARWTKIVTRQCHTTRYYMFRFIRTIISHLHYKVQKPQIHMQYAISSLVRSNIPV